MPSIGEPPLGFLPSEIALKYSVILVSVTAKALTVIATSSKPCSSAASIKSAPAGINIGIKI